MMHWRKFHKYNVLKCNFYTNDNIQAYNVLLISNDQVVTLQHPHCHAWVDIHCLEICCALFRKIMIVHIDIQGTKYKNLFRYHRLTIEYNEIYIYTMSVKNKDQAESK